MANLVSDLFALLNISEVSQGDVANTEGFRPLAVELQWGEFILDFSSENLNSLESGFKNS